MRLILLAFFLASNLTLAAPPQQWITDPPNGTTYLKREMCPGECFPLVENGQLIDASIASVQDVQEPDGTYRKVDARDCADEDACRAELSEMSCASAEPIFAEKAGGGFEVYCPEPRMRTVRKLALDPAKLAAREAAEAARVQAEQAKASARSAAIEALKVAQKREAAMTAAQQRDALLKVIELLLENEK